METDIANSTANSTANSRKIKDLMEKEDVTSFISEYIGLRKRYGDMTSSLVKGFAGEKFLPVSIFSKELSCLEVIVKYLKEKGMSFEEISRFLDRNYNTIFTTYRNANAKYKGVLDVSGKLKIPCSILKNRELSVLENIVLFLKVELCLSISEISGILKRDKRTVWTVYDRAARKVK